MKTNKIREYIMLKDKFSHAKLEEIRCYDWNGNLKYTDEIYKMLNEIFKMDSLITELSYVIALDHANNPKGVCRIGQGDASETPTSMQNIFTFLLLTGANAFVLVHNHISEMPEASESDRMITSKTNIFANMFDMEFIGHMIINPNGYIINGGTMDNTRRKVCNDGNLIDYEVCGDECDFDEEDVESFENVADETDITFDELSKQARMLREKIERGGRF